jgi:hypothetical protein
MSITAILLIAAALTGAFFLYKNFSKSPELSPEVEKPHEDAQEEIVSAPTPSLAQVTERVEKAEETAEEMNKRLSTITNPDSDKPFAKFSVPEISEVPEVVEKVEESLKEEAPVAEEAPKPKRKYNKKKKS